MFAGWIGFSAARRADDGRPDTLRMRADDPIHEVGMTLGGHRREDRLWGHTLRALAAHFAVQARVDNRVVCVDVRRRWARDGNVWQRAALPSTGHRLTAPLRRAPAGR